MQVCAFFHVCLDMKAVHLTDLSARMKASGYNEIFRQQVIMSAMQGFDNMVEEASRLEDQSTGQGQGKLT